MTTLPDVKPVPPGRTYRKDPAWSNHQDVPEPVADRRLTGAHWWDPDRLAHVADQPRFCPHCGGALDGPGSIAIEYWQGENRVFHTRCDRCDWKGDITRIERMIGIEPPHDD